MGKFLDAIKALFPRARAFSFFTETNKRQFVEALSVLPEHTRNEAEKAFLDLFPDTTRFPELWEKTFALFFSSAEYPKRRTIVSSLWAAMAGGQSAVFLEDMLRRIDDRLRVVENIPISNPRHSSVVDMSVNGNNKMRCGNRKAVNNYRRGSVGFLPTVIQNDATAAYAIPFDPKWWSTCFFVCAGVYRSSSDRRILFARTLQISAVWRNYVEYLVLKIKPVHTTAIMFIEWV